MSREDGQRELGRPVVVTLGALVVLAGLVALAAVLDLGPFGENGGDALSEAEFTAEGDQICERAHDQFAELQATPPNSAEGAAALTQGPDRDLRG